MRISDWRSDVCSSDLQFGLELGHLRDLARADAVEHVGMAAVDACRSAGRVQQDGVGRSFGRSEEHTSELQSLMRISYAVFCLTKKKRTSIALKHAGLISKNSQEHLENSKESVI